MYTNFYLLIPFSDCECRIILISDEYNNIKIEKIEIQKEKMKETKLYKKKKNQVYIQAYIYVGIYRYVYQGSV